MTAPLDEKGLDAASAALTHELGPSFGRTRAVASSVVSAYLAASPSPSMEMEVVQIDATDRDMIARGDRIGAKLVRQLLAHHDQAQSALAAMQMERDEARNLCDDTEAQVMDYAYRLEAAEAQVLRLTEENEALRKESMRLERITTRFPEHMAKVIALKDEPLAPRLLALKDALGAISDSIHEYQWVADVRPVFGDKFVRSVAGDNGHGMGRQAIAAIPSHLDGVAEFIAAANPDTIAILLADFLAAEARIKALEEALRPFVELGDHILAEAPPEDDNIVLFTDSGGEVHAIMLEDFRRARSALKENAL